MCDIVFVRIGHSLEEEFGYLSTFGCVEISSGICWLAAVTRKNNYRTEIIDALPLKLNNDEVAGLIYGKRSKYVGISACTMDIYAAADLAGKIKRMMPDTVILVGGPHVTAAPKQTMERFAALDIGVLGEGEETIVELLGSLEKRTGKRLDEIDGIIYRKDGRMIVTGPRNFIENLDSLALPAWDLLPDIRRYYFAPAWTIHSGKTATIITSRGCPYQCIFCDRKVFGNRVRYHGARYVIDMMTKLKNDYGICHFRIGDDNFIENKKRLYEICEAITQTRLNITWSCLARADYIDEDTLSAMKKAGCWSVAFGVESGSQKILDFEKKHITLDRIEKAVAMAKKFGIKTISFNIIGHPFETIDTIKETIRFNKRIKVDEFKTEFMVPFPGTDLYNHAEKYGDFDKDWRKMCVFREPIFIPRGLTKEDMIRWNKRGFVSFYSQPRIIMSYLGKIQNMASLRIMLIGAFTMMAWVLKELFSRKQAKRK